MGAQGCSVGCVVVFGWQQVSHCRLCSVGPATIDVISLCLVHCSPMGPLPPRSGECPDQKEEKPEPLSSLMSLPESRGRLRAIFSAITPPLRHWQDPRPSLQLSPNPTLTLPLTFPPTSGERAYSWDSANFSSS